VKKIYIVIAALAASQISYAGLKGLTVHSRANCINNESITWDATHQWRLQTTSDHRDARTNMTVHYLDTGWQTTWRSAAVHWGEGRGGWAVYGSHNFWNGRQVVSLGTEYVTDCSIYDGWWDKK
jgi:hypothetical protein